jgi:signal transduction histidine kinase
MPMPEQNITRSSSAVQRLTMLAVFASVLIATSLPLGYFLSVYYRDLGALEAEARSDSLYVSALASENPMLWEYQEHRLQDVLNRRPRKGTKESRTVYNHDGRVIAESDDRIDSPVMRETYPVLDAGRPVGAIEIKRSLRPLFLHTAFVALMSLSLGYTIFFLIRIMPIRSVQQAEAQSRRYADELEETNADLRAFIFSIAHDLRAPLVNLKGFSSELRRELGDVTPELMNGLASLKDDERQRVAAVLEQAVPEALGYIDSSTLRLDSLINAVLHLSRIDFRALHPEVIDMEELVHIALETFAHTIKEKNLTVTRGPLPSVVGDRMVMEQCMANLLDNAFKYPEPGRAGAVSITAERTADEVIVSVADNGRGIAPDDVQKVFEIFRRAGQQDTPGEGMGLAFVKALIRRQGGNIRCESVLGKGSTFSLSLPVNHGQRIVSERDKGA